jgi:predicted PurR-regulated permease PerM
MSSNNSISNMNFPAYVKAVFIGLLIIMVVVIMIYGRSLLVPMLFAAYTAMLLVPLNNKLEKWKFPRGLATLTSLSLAIFIILGIFTFFFIQLTSFVNDLSNIQERIDDLINSLNSSIENIAGVPSDISVILRKEEIIELIKNNSKNITTAVLSTVGSLGGVILIPVFMFLFLYYRDHLRLFLIKIFHNHEAKKVNETLASVRIIIQQYLVGIGKVMVILAILSTGALLGLGIKHAVFFGVFAALMNLVPYVGPLAAAILPFTFALLTKDSLWYPFGVAIAFTLIQSIEGNFLTPKIVGSNVSLNPLITFIALLVGAAIWGVIGMILIIPTIAIMKKLFELSSATQPYAYLMGAEAEKKARWVKITKK